MGLVLYALKFRITTYVLAVLMMLGGLGAIIVTPKDVLPAGGINLAVAQVGAATNSIRAVMPPGTQPPIIVRYSASSVPVIQLALTSTKDSLNKVYDYAQYRIRQTLAQVPGSTLPSPNGV